MSINQSIQFYKTRKREIPKIAIEADLYDDEAMIRNLFKEQPEKGFDLLFRKYYSNLCNNAMKVVYAKEIAEDIVAEVFTNFWQSGVYERIETSYRAYLYRSVRNRAYNHTQYLLSRNSKIESIYLEKETEEATRPDEAVNYQELCGKLEAVLNSLPARSREAFVLNRIEGMKYKEVAEAMDISVSAVERLISRALSKVKKDLNAAWLSVVLLICYFL